MHIRVVFSCKHARHDACLVSVDKRDILSTEVDTHVVQLPVAVTQFDDVVLDDARVTEFLCRDEVIDSTPAFSQRNTHRVLCAWRDHT